MTALSLTKTRIQAGIYEGILRDQDGQGDTPELEVLLLEKNVGSLSLEADKTLDATWHVRFSIPADVLTDGIQTFLIRDQKSGDTLDSFSIITGEPLDDDLRGEIDLLRQELDMLKKAFRRHCAETGAA